jgi:hypothetical protein
MTSNSVPNLGQSGVSQTQPYTQLTTQPYTQQPSAGPPDTSRIIKGNNIGISVGPTIRAPNTSGPLVSRGFDYQGNVARFAAEQERQQQAREDILLESDDQFDTRKRINKKGGTKRKRQKRHKKRQTKRHKKRQTKRQRYKI